MLIGKLLFSNICLTKFRWYLPTRINTKPYKLQTFNVTFALLLTRLGSARQLKSSRIEQQYIRLELILMCDPEIKT